MANGRTPPKKMAGMQSGRRRINGEVVTDVAGATIILGNPSEKATYAQVARAVIPYRRRQGRLIFVVDELQAYLRSLPGVSLEEALENAKARGRSA